MVPPADASIAIQIWILRIGPKSNIRGHRFW